MVHVEESDSIFRNFPGNSKMSNLLYFSQKKKKNWGGTRRGLKFKMAFPLFELGSELSLYRYATILYMTYVTKLSYVTRLLIIWY